MDIVLAAKEDLCKEEEKGLILWSPFPRKSRTGKPGG
jgi:hypothetical protein